MRLIYLLSVVVILESCASDQGVSSVRFNKNTNTAEAHATDSITTSASDGTATAEGSSAVGSEISSYQTAADQPISTGNNNNGPEGFQKIATGIDGTQTADSMGSGTEAVNENNGQEAVNENNGQETVTPTPTPKPNQTLDGFPLNANDLELMGRFASYVVNDKNGYVFHPSALDLQLAVYFEYSVHDKTISDNLFAEITIPQPVPTSCYSAMPYGKYRGTGLAHDNYDYRRDIRKKALDCLDSNGFKIIDKYGQLVLAKGYLGAPNIRTSLIVVGDAETLTSGSKLYKCALDKNERTSLTLGFMTTDPNCHAKRVTDSSARKCLTFGSDCADRDKNVKETSSGIAMKTTYVFSQALSRSGSKPSYYDTAKKNCILSRFSKLDASIIAPMWAGGAAFSTQAACMKNLNTIMYHTNTKPCSERTKGGDIYAYWGFDRFGKISGSSTTCKIE